MGTRITEITSLQSRATTLESYRVTNVADLDALAAVSPTATEGRIMHVDEGDMNFQAVDGVWKQIDASAFATTAARDTAYAKAAAAYRVQGVQSIVTDATTKLRVVYEYFAAYNATTNLSGTSMAGAPAAGWYAVPSQTTQANLSFSKSVANVTEYVLTGGDYTVEVRDVMSWHDIVTNTSRITPTLAGLYQIFYYAGWAVNAAGGRISRLKKNGATVRSFESGAAGSSPSGNWSLPMYFEDIQMNGTTDYLEFGMYQSSGGALTCSGDVVVKYAGAPVGPS